MMPYRILRNRSARTAAAVGALAAASATAMIALVSGTAAADEPGRCLENVNVREDPEPEARIVAVCQAGTQVKLGETQDGFVHLTDLDGWAVQQYIKADNASAASSAPSDRDAAGPTEDRADQEARRAREAAERRGDDDEASESAGEPAESGSGRAGRGSLIPLLG
jgi:hypothetical protein